MAATVKVTTFGNKSILFQYTRGQKTVDDITNAITHNIGYSCDGLKKFSYRVDNKILHEKAHADPLDEITALYMVPYREVSSEPPCSTSTIEVTVKTLSDKIFQIKTNPSNSIEHLKMQIEAQSGIQAESQNLIFKGKRISDNQTLGSYGVGDKSEIYLTLSLRGGMYHEISGRDGLYRPLPEIMIYDLDTDTIIM